MKKILVSLSLVIVFAWKAEAQDTVTNCAMASVIAVDGKADEWTLPWIDDGDKNFSYNVCSDDNNIYIRMKTSNDMIKRKIGLFGLTVWMDPKGKKKRKLGFKFPSGSRGPSAWKRTKRKVMVNNTKDNRQASVQIFKRE